MRRLQLLAGVTFVSAWIIGLVLEWRSGAFRFVPDDRRLLRQSRAQVDHCNDPDRRRRRACDLPARVLPLGLLRRSCARATGDGSLGRHRRRVRLARSDGGRHHDVASSRARRRPGQREHALQRLEQWRHGQDRVPCADDRDRFVVGVADRPLPALAFDRRPHFRAATPDQRPRLRAGQRAPLRLVGGDARRPPPVGDQPLPLSSANHA